VSHTDVLIAAMSWMAAILVGHLGRLLDVVKLLCDYTETAKSKQRLLRDNRRHSEVDIHGNQQ